MLLAALPAVAFPNASSVPDDNGTLSVVEEVLVVAARAPRSVDQVVGKVDVITHQQLIDEMATSLGDVVRYTPGISVATADSRFGETEFTIRGLSGNRVVSLIDGVPLPDQFDIGAFANAGQDFLVVDAIERIEVLRGPASTLFGNDALGGVIAVVTRDPDEFLDGSPLALGANATWSGRDDSTTLNGSIALGGRMGDGRLSGVLHTSRKDGHEVDRSAVEGAADRQDRSQRSLFAKSIWELASGGRLHLDASVFDEEVHTDVSSILGYGRQFRNTTALRGDDRRRRYAARLGYEFGADRWWIDHGRLNGYWQRVAVDQRTTDLRAALNTLNERAFSYDTESYGATLDLGTRGEWGRIQHRLAWGASLERSRVSEQRDGTMLNLLTGQRSSSLLGEVMPVRDFPRSTVDEVGIYAQDEMTVGRLTVIPGLRFQSYRLDARSDPIFAQDNPGTGVIDANESVVAPKLGLLWRVGDHMQAYLQYAHGFRAPPFEDVNIGLDNPLFNYRAIPNPELKPETSDGVEVGFRYIGGDVRFGAAIFSTEYDDLIETKVNLGRDANGTLIFQSQNIEAARVYGAELSFESALDRWIPGLRVEAAASIARGENRATGEHLETVDPAELVTRLSWSRSDRVRFGLVLTAVAAKDDVDAAIASPMTTDGYLVLDVTGSLRLSPAVRIDAGLFNAFDTTYWQWSAVRNRAADDPMVDHLSAPGRYASVSVRVAL